jgi:hypothetical protein
MPRSVLTLVNYTAKPGCEEQLEGVLRTHIARLTELGLVADKPHFVAQRSGTQNSFVESFWWRDEGAKHIAHDNSEVQEMWMRVEDLCTEGGVQHTELELLT